MAKKLARTHVKKEKGYLYFVDKDGDIACAAMVRGGAKKRSKKKATKKRK